MDGVNHRTSYTLYENCHGLFVLCERDKKMLHLILGFFQTVWTINMVEELKGLLLTPTLAPEAPQHLQPALVDLHLLVEDIRGNGMPLLGGFQHCEGCPN